MALKLYLRTGDWLFLEHPQGATHLVTNFVIDKTGKPVDSMFRGKFRYHAGDPWAEGAIKTQDIVAVLEVPDAE